MQGWTPDLVLITMVGIFLFMVFMTYYGINWLTGSSTSSFNRPQLSTYFGIWTFLFLGMILGIVVILAMFTGDLNIVGMDWLLNNIHGLIVAVAFLVCFSVPLGYLYIYRGGR